MDTNNLLSWIYIISFPMTLILLWIWKKRIHHPLLGIGSLCFSLSTFVSLLLMSIPERRWFTIICHAMCMIGEIYYIYQNWKDI